MLLVHAAVSGLPADCNSCFTLSCPVSPVRQWYHNSSLAFNNEDYIITGQRQIKACHQPIARRNGVYRCVTDKAVWTFTVQDFVLQNSQSESLDQNGVNFDEISKWPLAVDLQKTRSRED